MGTKTNAGSARRAWDSAQKHELACWRQNRERIKSSDYLAVKRRLWNEILERIGLSSEKLLHRRVLEVGCGPSGITILYRGPEIRTKFTILDPLLGKYRALFPEYFGKCREIVRSLEDWRWSPVDRFDFIFAINVIDHCRDIRAFLGQLRALAVQNGATVVIGVNTHRYTWSRWLWRAFRIVIEPQHPHHYTRGEYLHLFREYFEVRSVIDIEDIVVRSLKKTGYGEKKPAPPLRRVLRVFKPSNILFSLLAVTGCPPHDLTGAGRSIFRNHVFIAMPRRRSTHA